MQATEHRPGVWLEQLPVGRNRQERARGPEPATHFNNSEEAMTPQEQLEILTAYVAGEVIQYQPDSRLGWGTIINGSTTYKFDFEHNKYRKKPKPLELWVNVYGTGSGEAYAHFTKEDAIVNFAGGGRTVHMREVVDD